jgi:hypothetical protein
VSRECLGIFVAQNIFLYTAKGNLEMTLKYMYMDFSKPTGMEIWIDEG